MQVLTESVVRTAPPSAQLEAISIVVPALRGDPDEVYRCLAKQTFHDYAVYVVHGVSPAARARNLGAAAAQGVLLLFLDADISFDDERLLETLAAAMAHNPDIGVAGAAMLLPPDATWLQRRIAAELPRWSSPIVKVDTESNPPTDRYGFSAVRGPCCIIRRSAYQALCGFDERLTTGEDTEFFYRLRRAGYRFLIPPDCWIYHPPPRRLSNLLRKSFHYGIGHAQEAQKAPTRQLDILRLGRWYGKLFVMVAPIFFPASCFVSLYLGPVRHWKVGFRPLKALSTYATLYGYAFGWFCQGKA